jgi:von Willebrand factor type A domain
MGLEITPKTWWSSLLRHRDRGRALRLIASNVVGLVVLLLWASQPAAAAGDELPVIAVHTASAPRVSMVVAPPAERPDDSATVESCTVIIDGEPVACTVIPMASDSLSVALVIDTASDLTAQELAAVKNGAAEFLLRLPDGAHTMVVAAGGVPQVLAPLSERRGEALSAISAFRVGGSRATMAATMLATQSLESAAPGPRAIIVYTRGPDEQGVLLDRLSQAVLRSEAVVNVIRTSTDALWPSVVEQAGGVVVTTNAENLVQSFGDVAATLGEQYLVTFEAPGDLPAVARVAFQTGDQEFTTVVNLPDAGPAGAAPTESSDGPPASGVPWLVALLAAGLALTALGVFLRRAGHPRPADGGKPSTEVASPPTGAPPADKAAAASTPIPQPVDEAVPSAPAASLSDDPAPNGPPRRPLTSSAESRSARKSLSAAIEGRRLARLILDSQPELRTEPAEQRDKADNKTEDTPTDQQARYMANGHSTASSSEAGAEAERGRPETTAAGEPT